MICGFLNDHGDTSLKRSTPLGHCADLMCKLGVGKLRASRQHFVRPAEQPHVYR